MKKHQIKHVRKSSRGRLFLAGHKVMGFNEWYEKNKEKIKERNKGLYLHGKEPRTKNIYNPNTILTKQLARAIRANDSGTASRWAPVWNIHELRSFQTGHGGTDKTYSISRNPFSSTYHGKEYYEMLVSWMPPAATGGINEWSWSIVKAEKNGVRLYP